MRREQALRVKQRIKCIGEEPGMAGGSSQNETVFILHLSLDDPVAEGCVLFGWRDCRSPISGRTKAGAGHPKRPKHLTRAKGFQRLAGDRLERSAYEDESRVGVLGTAPRGSFE